MKKSKELREKIARMAGEWYDNDKDRYWLADKLLALLPSEPKEGIEIASIKKLVSNYDEFGTVFDPECQLPYLADSVANIMAELLGKIAQKDAELSSARDGNTFQKKRYYALKKLYEKVSIQFADADDKCREHEKYTQTLRKELSSLKARMEVGEIEKVIKQSEIYDDASQWRYAPEQREKNMKHNTESLATAIIKYLKGERV